MHLLLVAVHLLLLVPLNLMMRLWIFWHLLPFLRFLGGCPLGLLMSFGCLRVFRAWGIRRRKTNMLSVCVCVCLCAIDSILKNISGR